MKNNKAMTYVLLALVVGIWGYVIYSILAKVGDEETPILRTANTTSVDENLTYYRWKDSLPYDTLYHSPFSATLGEIPVEPIVETVDMVPPAEQYDPLAFAPAMDVQYLGYIENENQKNRVALVQINGKQYYLRPKQQVDGVTLLSVGASEIRIKTDYQTLTINKQ